MNASPKKSGQGYATDTLDARKKFLQTELDVVQQCTRPACPFWPGRIANQGVRLSGLQLARRATAILSMRVHALEALQTATLNPARFFGMESQSAPSKAGSWRIWFYFPPIR